MISISILYSLSAVAFLILLIEHYMLHHFFIEADELDYEYEILTSERGWKFIAFKYDYTIKNKNFSSSQLVRLPDETQSDEIIKNLKVKAFKYINSQSKIVSPWLLKNHLKNIKKFVFIIFLGNMLVFCWIGFLKFIEEAH